MNATNFSGPGRTRRSTTVLLFVSSFNQHLYLNSLNKYQIVDMFLRWSFLQISSLSNRARLWTGRPCHVNLWILDYRRSDRTRIFLLVSCPFTAFDLSSAFISINFNPLFFIGLFMFLSLTSFILKMFCSFTFLLHFSLFQILSFIYTFCFVLFSLIFPIEVFVSQI